MMKQHQFSSEKPRQNRAFLLWQSVYRLRELRL